ncbi:hypothetical protein [Limisalsivibrio acetivorans]|uniref:hypothetical protein n=1 Tax=Limisalsivibrio acetivorans TaxID=1304888 RepID=UPI0003B30DED|nr:hypothetical protein [Limisalsivibrio acetivorans]
MKRFLFAALCFALLSTQAFAGDLIVNLDYSDGDVSQHEYEGGTDELVYGGDDINTGVISDQPYFEDDEAQTGDGNTVEVTPQYNRGSIALNTFITPNTQIISVPVSYKLVPRFKLKASFPYVRRTIEDDDGEEYTRSGIGDISAGFSWLSYKTSKTESVTDLMVTLPTGDADGEDSEFAVPVGSGGYSLYVSQKLSHRVGTSRFTILGDVAYRHFFSSDYAIGDTDQERERGGQITLSGGTRYKFNDRIRAAARIRYLRVAEGQIKQGDGDWEDSDDYMAATDLILTVQTRFYKRNWFVAGVVIPVATDYDDDVEDEEGRKWAFLASVSAPF